MKVRPATAADLDFVVAQEQRPENADFIIRWDRAVHEANLQHANFRYLIVERDDGAAAGFAILSGLESAHGSIELTRIVMATPGRGEGRAACRDVLDLAFGELAAHRVSLDVFEGNARALHLYTSLGFMREGLLRDAVRIHGQYRSLIVMSMLAREYREAGPPVEPSFNQ
jgi:diamine N-acetyltransferase